MRSTMKTFAITGAVLMTAGMLVAGPLNPPAGPVGSTYKTLTEVEPRIALGPATTPGDGSHVYRITQPGSYYLTGNISVPTGLNGIRVEADGVTLDLNGFSVQGVAGSLTGIACGARERIHVRHGFLRGLTAGIDGLQARSLSVESVRAEGCGFVGIRVGENSRVEDCQANGNSGTGILTYGAGVVRECEAAGNTDGFEIGGQGVVERCVANDNTRDGFTSSDGVRFSGCVATSNGRDGISLRWGSEARDCHANANTRHGFIFGSYCTIEGNMSRANDGAGFYGEATGSRTVLRGNNSVQNAVGIQLDGAGNLVVGNACSSNPTNYLLVANNRVAAIVTMALSGAVNGNSGGTTVAGPDSNYAY